MDGDGKTPFNFATLVLIPKKTARTSDDGTRYFRPESLRHLSVVKTGNRLMANAYRLQIEPIIERAISPSQRGFLPGRSMLANIMKVDTAIQKNECHAPKPRGRLL